MKKQLATTLYLVTDSTGLSEEAFLEKVEQARQGGVTFLQLREKERSTRAYIRLARQVHALARRHQVPLVVDDRVDVALAAEVDGVHVGQSDMPVWQARKLLGPDKIVGATAKTVPQALEALEQGADYLGGGAIYPTTTKVVTVITSTDTLGEICRAVPIPVNAIGGLNRDNLGVLKGIPIAGICVVSAIMKSADPKAAAEGLRQAFDGLRKE